MFRKSFDRDLLSASIGEKLEVCRIYKFFAGNTAADGFDALLYLVHGCCRRTLPYSLAERLFPKWSFGYYTGSQSSVDDPLGIAVDCHWLFFSLNRKPRIRARTVKAVFIFISIEPADYHKLASTDFRDIKILTKRFAKCQYRDILESGCLRIEMPLW